jgi:prepilin-type N-terminal cleavage/methylation domain-containing protein
VLPWHGMRDHNRTSGFTLIELLITVAIIGVLMGMLLPVIGKIRESANRASCGSRLRQIGIAAFAYAGDTNDCLPDGGPYNNPSKGRCFDQEALAYRGLLDYVDFSAGSEWRKRFFTCPSNRTKGSFGADIHYLFFPGGGNDMRIPVSRIAAVAQRYGVPGGNFALFADATFTFDWGTAIGYEKMCNHKGKGAVPGWLASLPDSGVPAGANVVNSDGSVLWAAYTDGVPHGERVSMVFNGGSVGGHRVVPSNMVMFRLDSTGKLDQTSRWDNVMIGCGYGSTGANINFATQF